MRTLAVVVLLSAAVLAQSPARLQPDPAIDCGKACAAWNEPLAPFKVFGNTYYVGPRGVSAVLIAGPDGHILLDGGLPQSVPLIDQNIRAVGFRTEDVKLILNSHAHYDHAGGIAALQRFTNATVAASASGAQALRRGQATPDDPQFAAGDRYPAVASVRAVSDGETLRVGPLAITAHLTPGHTPGSTAWTWRACDGTRCLDVVYADSLNPVATDGFRYLGDATTPERVGLFRRSLLTVSRLPCDILLSPHADQSGVLRRLERARKGDADAFIDRGACHEYAAAASIALDRRVAAETRVPPPRP